MARTGLLFGIFALLAFFAGSFVPLVGTFLPFLSVIALGWGAGYTAAKVTNAVGGQRAGRGAGSGALAGLVTLLGTVAGLALLGQLVRSIILSNPALQAQIEQFVRQQDPSAANVPLDQVLSSPQFLPVLLVVGFCVGLIPLFLMTIAGLIGGLMWSGTPAPTSPGDYVAAGSSSSTSSQPSTTYSQPGTTYDSSQTGTTYDSGQTGTTYNQPGTTYDTTQTGTSYNQSDTTYTQPGTPNSPPNDNPPEGEGGVRVYDSDDRPRS